jgi:RsiW-degrading membrane proteinase PrsW (M82 family)
MTQERLSSFVFSIVLIAVTACWVWFLFSQIKSSGTDAEEIRMLPELIAAAIVGIFSSCVCLIFHHFIRDLNEQ